MLHQTIAEFISILPEEWSYLVIPKKGTVLIGRDGKRHTYCGKRAWGGTTNSYCKSELLAELARLDYVEAVGFKPGPQSDGVVVLDIDLAGARDKLIETYGELPETFEVRSTKGGGCGKLLYRIEDHWFNKIKGRQLRNDLGYEILWGRASNAVIVGEYPGKPERNIPAGTYEWLGTPDQIAPAPQWLIDEMRREFQKDNRLTDDGSRFLPKDWDTSYRTEAQLVEVIRLALSVIPNGGQHSEDQWSRIGSAIYSVLPNERGLALWEEWSRQDRDYQEEWENGNPCADRWAKGFVGTVKLGSLVRMAASELAGSDNDEQAIRYWIRKHFGSHAEANQRVEVLTPEDFQLPNDLAERYLKATQNKVGYELLLTVNNFCRSYKIRHDKLEKLVRTWRTEQRQQSNPYRECATLREMLEIYNRRVPGEDFLIPGLLPMGAVVMLYADGGSGKTLLANYLAALVGNAIDQAQSWGKLHIQGGRVLYLQSDQGAERALFQVSGLLQDHPLMAGSDNVRMKFGWDASRLLELIDWIEEWEPKLLVVDSLFHINRTSMAEEKDAAYAHVLDDLRELAETYGLAVLVIHHVNHGGAMRGSKKLRDNCDEVWALKRLEGASMVDRRRHLHVDKTRTGVPRTLALTLQEDLTWVMEGEVIDPDDANKPVPLTDRLLTYYEGRKTSDWVSLSKLRTNIMFESEDRRRMNEALMRLANRGHLECQDTSEGRAYRHVRWKGQEAVAAPSSSFMPGDAPPAPSAGAEPAQRESLSDWLQRHVRFPQSPDSP
jgi:archaellum biogenesis ATPase FlaH